MTHWWVNGLIYMSGLCVSYGRSLKRNTAKDKCSKLKSLNGNFLSLKSEAQSLSHLKSRKNFRSVDEQIAKHVPLQGIHVFGAWGSSGSVNSDQYLAA